jgi:hypothetical protein
MKTNRLALHEELCTLLGSRYVYYQPGTNTKMKYPCIVYRRGDIEPRYANDMTYVCRERYTLTVVSGDPDNEIADKLLSHFRLITYTNRYLSDNLYHDTLELYY